MALNCHEGAGHSAYLVDLPRAIQDKSIARTEHGL